MTAEEWRSVEWDSRYEVSSRGRVRSYASPSGGSYPDPHPLKLEVSRHGYYRVRLTRRGESYKPLVHLIVAEAFLGSRPEGQVVRHKDGDKLNISADNLEYGTRSENEDDKLRHGTRVWGEKCHLSKLTEEQVIAIRAEVGSNAAIAKRYGVTRQLIWQIRTHRIWKWIQD